MGKTRSTGENLRLCMLVCILEKCRTLGRVNRSQHLDKIFLTKIVNCRCEFLFMVKGRQAHKVQLCRTYTDIQISSICWAHFARSIIVLRTRTRYSSTLTVIIAR